MSDVIEFLERAGQDPQWRHASPDDMAKALADAQIAPDLRSAILAGDPKQLQILMGQEREPFLILMPDPSKTPEPEPAEQPGEQPNEEEAPSAKAVPQGASAGAVATVA
jgi:hypothetical protein